MVKAPSGKAKKCFIQMLKNERDRQNLFQKGILNSLQLTMFMQKNFKKLNVLQNFKYLKEKEIQIL